MINLTGASDIAAGYDHSCVRTTSGQVKCWGANGQGQLGMGNTNTSPNPTPVLVSGLTGVTSFHSQATSNCAIIANGQVKCWGDNQFGQLGNGTVNDSSTPVLVMSTTEAPPLLTGAISIRLGGPSTCATITGGGVKCWGLNNYGQLGNGTTGGNFAAPVNVIGL